MAHFPPLIQFIKIIVWYIKKSIETGTTDTLYILGNHAGYCAFFDIFLLLTFNFSISFSISTDTDSTFLYFNGIATPDFYSFSQKINEIDR